MEDTDAAAYPYAALLVAIANPVTVALSDGQALIVQGEESLAIGDGGELWLYMYHGGPVLGLWAAGAWRSVTQTPSALGRSAQN